MKKLLKYMKSYIKECILGPLFKMGEALFELFVPLVVAKIIDLGIENNDADCIIKYGFILVVIAFCGLLLSVSAQYFAAKASVGFVTKIRSELFRKIESFSYSDIDKLGTSTAITRMVSDINQIQTGTNLTIRLLLRSPFIVFGSVIMAFTVDGKSAVVFVCLVPILSAVVFGVMLSGIPIYKKVQKKLDIITKLTRENLNGVRVIRAFARETEEEKNFKSENNALVKIQEFAGKISGIMNPVTYVLVNIAIIVLIYVGAVRVNSGSLSQGSVVALYNYMSQILVELVKLASLIITITKSVACGNRVGEILDKESSDKFGECEKGGNGDIIIEFDNVSLKYNAGADTALENISFKVKKGEKTGIIGSTGSGKTSVVNLIPKFYGITEGEIYIDGKNINNYSEEFIRSFSAVAEQTDRLFKGTVRENMLFGNENADDEEIISALKKAQAYDFIREKDGFLDFVIEQNGSNLSGGQKQRLNIARAIIKNAPVLILDDTSSALDFKTDADIRKEIFSIKDKTVIIVSQRISAVWECDKILVLDDGRQAGFATHNELMENCDVYKEIYNSQFRKEGVSE